MDEEEPRALRPQQVALSERPPPSRGQVLTDDEWRLVEPLIPPGKPGGGKRTVIVREVVNGLMYTPTPRESEDLPCQAA